MCKCTGLFLQIANFSFMGAMSFCFHHIYVSDVSQKKLVLKDVLIKKLYEALCFFSYAHVKFADFIFELKKNLIDVGNHNINT